jgi:retinal rod rhodopsin-sensitive cGMP 3',5'-cyclic phosphodiesterase subunit delta
LQLKAVSREMNFSSVETIKNFHLVQSVSLRGQPLEEWRFSFGFVIPGSTNTWACTIESAGAEAMIPAQILSGHVVIETQFFDGEVHASTTRQRVFYV